MESMTNHLFEPIKEVCPICNSKEIYKLKGMIVCNDCGDYLVLKKAGEIKETIRSIKKIK